jgi:hypothetical protein
MVEIDAVHVEAIADLFDFSLVPHAAFAENLEESMHFSLLSQQNGFRIYDLGFRIPTLKREEQGLRFAGGEQCC